MNTEFRYQLESKKLTGHQPRKLPCPHCGKKKCFVRYVDIQNGFRYVADSVGKCDHLHSCGYHYKPSEYYRDNQWAHEPETGSHCTPIPLPPFQPIPSEYVSRSQSLNSVFWQWFSNDVAIKLGFTSEQVLRIYEDYLIGATRRGNVIFWQIDHEGLVHGGHIMQYRIDGHRDGFQGWTHVPLIKVGLLPPNWQLYQCIYSVSVLMPTSVLWRAKRQPSLWRPVSHNIFGWLQQVVEGCLWKKRTVSVDDASPYFPTVAATISGTSR